jgi:hypothetical protein
MALMSGCTPASPTGPVYHSGAVPVHPGTTACAGPGGRDDSPTAKMTAGSATRATTITAIRRLTAPAYRWPGQGDRQGRGPADPRALLYLCEVIFFPKWRGSKDGRWRFQMVVLLLILAIGVEQAFAWPAYGAIGLLSNVALVGVASAAMVWWWRCWRQAK